MPFLLLRNPLYPLKEGMGEKWVCILALRSGKEVILAALFPMRTLPSFQKLQFLEAVLLMLRRHLQPFQSFAGGAGEMRGQEWGRSVRSRPCIRTLLFQVLGYFFKVSQLFGWIG